MDRYENLAYSSEDPPDILRAEQLEWLASISPRHEEKLRRLRRPEAEAKANARDDREQLEWLASISERHEHKLHELLRKEAEERQSQERFWQLAEGQVTQEEWVEADHLHGYQRERLTGANG